MSRSGDVALSVDGTRAVALFEHLGNVDVGFDVAMRYRVKSDPDGPDSRLAIMLDQIYLASLDQTPLWGPDREEGALHHLAHFAVGEHLDSGWEPPRRDPDSTIAKVSADAPAQSLYARRKPRPTDTVFTYIGAKLYWSWRFGFPSVVFSLADHLRLGVPVGDIDRVALAGEGVYWNRTDMASSTYVPTPKLLRDVPAGQFGKLARPVVMQVLDQLEAPRYAATREHFKKALEFLNGQNQDLHNSVKEAVASVESLAMLVSGRDKGTLGDFIKDLRGTGRITAPLDKAFEALWGYSSEQPGVRHGRGPMEQLADHEVAFILNLAASALLFLLQLDS